MWGFNDMTIRPHAYLMTTVCVQALPCFDEANTYERDVLI